MTKKTKDRNFLQLPTEQSPRLHDRRNIRTIARCRGKFLTAGMIFGLYAALTGFSAMAQTETETEKNSSQRKAQIVLVSIVGNEITYYEEQPETEDQTDQTEKLPEAEDQTEKLPETDTDLAENVQEETGTAGESGMKAVADAEEVEKSLTDGSTPGGAADKTGSDIGSTARTEENAAASAPDMNSMSGSAGKPDMNSRPSDGDMSDMSDMSGSRNMPGGNNGNTMQTEETAAGNESTARTGGNARQQIPDQSIPQNSGQSMSQNADESMPQSTGKGNGFSENEIKTAYIPVGAVVHTDKGTDTTFTILEAGDELEVLFETADSGDEMITEIWMK